MSQAVQSDCTHANGQSQAMSVAAGDGHEANSTTVTPDEADPSVLAQYPPWGESLLREYDKILHQWKELDKESLKSVSPERRRRLDEAKLCTFETAALIRARAVNAFLTLLRWSSEDAPGILEALLRDIIESATDGDFKAVAADVAALRTRRAS